MDITVFKTFGEALAIGLLIGTERYKNRAPGERKSAGTRTFTIIALLGAVCGLLNQPWFTLVTLGAVILLLGLGYYRHTSDSVGLTTEIAALLTFWIGYLMHGYESLAISMGIVLVILLAAKRGLHDFVKEQVSEAEFYDTLKFLAVVFVVFPLLPDRDIGPYQFFNPFQVWLLIVVVSTISYAGYILIRLLGGKRGLVVSALLGGIVSTTAVTMSLAERARHAPEYSRIYGVTGVMANAVQFPRLLLLVWVVDRSLGAFLMVPLLAMGAVGLLGAWIMGRLRRVTREEPPVDVLLQNPYSLVPALKFGLFLVGVFLFSRLATVWWDERGIYLASAIAGLGDASAISISAAKFVNIGSLSLSAASAAILIAVAMNALLKWILSLVNGNRELAFWLGGGFVMMLGTGALAMAAMHVF